MGKKFYKKADFWLYMIVIVGFLVVFGLVAFNYELQQLFFWSYAKLNFYLFKYASYVEPEQRWLVDTPTCKVLNWKTFDMENSKLYRNHTGERYQCAKFQDPRQRLVGLGKDYDRVYLPPGLNCTAQSLERDVDNNEVYQYGSVVDNFTSRPLELDALELNCEFEIHVVPLVPIKQPQFQPKAYGESTNVLMIGIDTLSRLHFLRHFPQTRQLFEAKGFIPFVGHHKVGDNTRPNLLAMLTGSTVLSWKQAAPSWEEAGGKLDFLDLIYKEFSSQGYLTTYGEDFNNHGLFNSYGGYGFWRPPIDYYLRPVSVRMEELKNTKHCYHEKLASDFFYDYNLDQMLAFRKRRQHFMIHTHLSSHTHDIFNVASFNDFGYLDHSVHQHLTQIFEHQLNQRTIIIFYSDHGPRFGLPTWTKSFEYETSLPVLYIYFPPELSLRDSGGQQLSNQQLRTIAQINSKRLTSQYDIHATLRHVLYGHPLRAPSYGQSLLTEIPANRTCTMAGIPDSYCQCSLYQSHKDKELGERLGKYLVAKINSMLKPFAHLCTELTFDSVFKLEIKSNFDQTNFQTFRVVVATLPSKAQFQATLRAHDKIVHLDGDINRLDAYDGQDDCMGDNSLAKYCYCKDLL